MFPLCSRNNFASLVTPATFESRSCSEIKAAETLTLLSTLPTLCSTPVATSAMPASREMSTSRRCVRSSSFSARFNSVRSRLIPTSPMILPALSRSGTLVTDAQAISPLAMICLSILLIMGWPVWMIRCSSWKNSRAFSLGKKSRSDLPMAASGSSTPMRWASARLSLRKRDWVSLK